MSVRRKEADIGQEQGEFFYTNAPVKNSASFR